MSNARDTAKNLKTGLNVAADGTIIDVQKDGTSVAKLGIQTSGFYIDGESGHEGIRFGNGSVNPRENGADSDGTSSLGTSSARWSDLYLSGGAYIGGTGAANKLSDYETGTWTASTNYGTISSLCWYIKIGDSVTVGGNIYSPTNSSSGNPFQINGVPFTSLTGRSSTGAIIGSYVSGGTYSAYISGNTNYLYFYKNPSSSGYSLVSHNNLASNSDIHFSITFSAA